MLVAINTTLHVVEDETHRFFEELREVDIIKNGEIDPVEDLKMLSLRVVSRAIYGPLSLELQRALEIIASEREVVFKDSISGTHVWRCLLTRAVRRAKAYQAK
jgi:hypothetical protein